MASAADAELVLRLYELRREETLRKARRFLVFDFNPKTGTSQFWQAGNSDVCKAVI